MTFSIPLAAWLALATTAQVPAGDARTAAVAPFIGDETVIAARLDLAKLDVPTTFRRIFGTLADDADLTRLSKVAESWADALKKAGATDVFILVDLTDMPGYPVVVVPLSAGADGRAIADLLTGKRPGGLIRWPSSETIRGAVVAGPPGALARIKDARPAPRPDLAAALASGGESPIQIAICLSTTQRRAIEESIPSLPAPLGGGPITDLTRGMAWASIALSTDPTPILRFNVRAKDADSAKTLHKIAQDGLGQLTIAARSNPSVAELADAIAQMKPQASGDRVTLTADLEKTAALVSVPVRQAREAALRAQCVNHLKQIGLAMHNYHQAHNSFPAAYIAAKDGKPLLSWRVLILPYIEQKTLFDQFHLDEAWDSPHNKTLIARMPETYACPDGKKSLAVEGKTTYLTPRGPATLFPGAEAIKIQEVTDGTSNTIMVVDANDDSAVIWTKPDDWEVAPIFQDKGLFGHHPNGTNLLFADGAVRFLKQTIATKVLQAMTTRNGGEVLNAAMISEHRSARTRSLLPAKKVNRATAHPSGPRDGPGFPPQITAIGGRTDSWRVPKSGGDTPGYAGRSKNHEAHAEVGRHRHHDGQRGALYRARGLGLGWLVRAHGAPRPGRRRRRDDPRLGRGDVHQRQHLQRPARGHRESLDLPPRLCPRPRPGLAAGVHRSPRHRDGRWRRGALPRAGDLRR